MKPTEQGWEEKFNQLISRLQKVNGYIPTLTGSNGYFRQRIKFFIAQERSAAAKEARETFAEQVKALVSFDREVGLSETGGVVLSELTPDKIRKAIDTLLEEIKNEK